MSEASDLVDAARNGTLAKDDQRLQAVRRRANQGVTADQNTLREINEAGGAHNGSANSWI